jgi:Fe-S cluster assembly protein SufD
MEVSNDIKNRFKALFESFENQLNGHKSNALHAYRRIAINNLDKLEFPTTRDENWKYTSLHRVWKPTYDLPKHANQTEPTFPSNPPLTDAIELRLQNGQLSSTIPALLPQGLTLLTIEQALELEPYAHLAKQMMEDKIIRSSDIFTQLSAGLGQQGIFIHVKAGTIVNQPIWIRHNIGSQDSAYFGAALMLVYQEKESQLTILEQFQSSNQDKESCIIVHNEHVLQPNAKLHHYKLQDIGRQQFMIYTNQADQYRDSMYFHFNADLGGRLVRNQIRTTQSDPNVYTHLYGIFPGNNEQHADTQTSIDHASPYGTSHEWYRSLLTGSARGVFNGKVIVRPDAQKINAYQQNDTLLLSDRARMDSKPQLEIFADDVRCSHGATIGQLDEEQQFYLQARGLDKEAAQQLLLWGFIGKISEFIPHAEIKSIIEASLEHKLRSITA